MVEIANSQGADLLTKPFEISVNNKPVHVEEPIVSGSNPRLGTPH